MYWLLIIGVAIVVIGLGFYFMDSYKENFQTETITMDVSGVDLRKVEAEIKNLKLDTTDIDSRPINDPSRVCDTIQKQIDTFQNVKQKYKDAGDWSNVQLTNRTVNSLKEQMTTLGCQNNNSQNN